MDKTLTTKLCKYIYKNFRSKYKSNRDFAIDCNIDEKTVRLIQQEKYNMSIRILSQICEAQNVKLSTIFKEIGE